VSGKTRKRDQDKGCALAGKSTLNRLELTPPHADAASRYDYVLGLPKNSRLKAIIAEEMAQARSQYEATEQAARVFKDFHYQTRTSWSCMRRVIGKAEHLAKGENPRFVVTTLSAEEWDACSLYEDLYCARGDMENRIKEQQLALFAYRTSTHEMRSNQLRLMTRCRGPFV
jgi:hypothetical protein